MCYPESHRIRASIAASSMNTTFSSKLMSDRYSIELGVMEGSLVGERSWSLI